MGIIEKWGSGMRRIFARCRKIGVKEPLVNVGGSTITITFLRSLPEEVAPTGEKVAPTGEKVAPAGEKSNTSLTTEGLGLMLPGLRKDVRRNVDRVLKEIVDNVYVSVEEIHDKTGISARAVKNAIAILRKAGVISRVGGSFGGHWKIEREGT